MSKIILQKLFFPDGKNHSSGRGKLFTVLFGVLFLALSSPTHFPQPVGFVNDFAGVIDESSRNKMEELIDFVLKKTGAEVVVVTVKSLGGESVEMFANKLFTEWAIGKKHEDNGVLILIALKEREIRIEVGYGLEPILPDGLCGEIIREDMVPLLRVEKYGEALLRATQRVADVITAHYKVRLPEKYQSPQISPELFDKLTFLGILLFFFVPFMVAFYGIFGKGLGFKGMVTAIPFLFFGLFFWGFYSVAVLEPLSKGKEVEKGVLVMLGVFYLFIILFLWVFIWGAGAIAEGGSRRKGKRKSGSSFWFGSGSFGGGGFGGGGGGFGGFGGGSSGGGGASGSW